MNKKLTAEQREWILDKLKEVSLELQDGNVSWTSVNIHRFEQALNAHTAEDECEVTIINPTRLVVFGADGFDTAEDEGNYIVWSDGRKTQIEDEELLQYIAENIQQEDKDE